MLRVCLEKPKRERIQHHAVPGWSHPSTKRAQHILSSEFGRDRLYYV